MYYSTTTLDGTTLAIILVIWIGVGALGYWIGNKKGRGVLGLVLGLLLGLIGLVIIAVIGPKQTGYPPGGYLPPGGYPPYGGGQAPPQGYGQQPYGYGATPQQPGYGGSPQQPGYGGTAPEPAVEVAPLQPSWGGQPQQAYAPQQPVVATQPEVVSVPVSKGGVLTLSPDRQHWWDGAAWRSVLQSAPPNADRSPDGSQWWDGAAWRPVTG